MGTMQYWWYLLVVLMREEATVTVWVGVVGPLCIFCLVLTYLLQHLRLRGGICPAVSTVVVPKLGGVRRG